MLEIIIPCWNEWCSGTVEDYNCIFIASLAKTKSENLEKNSLIQNSANSDIDLEFQELSFSISTELADVAFTILLCSLWIEPFMCFSHQDA